MTTIETPDGQAEPDILETFKARRQYLAEIAGRLAETVNGLAMVDLRDSLRALERRIRANDFKVLILGEFKRGKSTFINALLREEVLPAYAKPCTAIINEVKWGQEKKALLHHSGTSGGPAAKVEEIPVDQIEKFVVIKDERDGKPHSQFEKVELFWPLDLCKSGVTIIDSPGLNEHETRQMVTMNYLANIDAVLFVMSCEALASLSELTVIDSTLLAAGHEDLFFICNRFDAIRQKDREEIRAHGTKVLSSRTRHGAQSIFFVSALNALDGRLEGDSARVASSGIPQLEEALARFLGTERGRLKLRQPFRELKAALQKARRTLPERESMLRTDLSVLAERLKQAQEPLTRLEKQRDQILRQIDNKARDVRRVVAAEAVGFFRDAASSVVTWSKEVQLSAGYTIIGGGSTKEQIQRISGEVMTSLCQRLETTLATWQKDELQPLLEEHLKDLSEDLAERIKGFVVAADDVRLNLFSGGIDSNTANLEQENDLGPVERILAATGGFIIGGVGSSAIGATLGYGEMLKSLIPQIGITLITTLLVGFNPLILIPAMLAGGFVQGLLKQDGIAEKVKEKTGERFSVLLLSVMNERADELGDAAAEKIGEIKSAIGSGLESELRSLREQVDSVMREKHKGQQGVDEKLRNLAATRQSIDALDAELDELMAAVMG